MKSIETKWKGYRFRSRTEARWAVFLEALGVKFEYEPEGVVLPFGPYLPDFRFELYSDFKRANGVAEEVVATVWLEVKGQMPTDAERRRCAELAGASGNMVLLAVGAPDVKPQLYSFWGHPSDEKYDALILRYDGLATFGSCSDRGGIGLIYLESRPIPDPDSGDIYPATTQSWMGHAKRLEPYPVASQLWKPAISPEMRRAYDAARSARFEFGETDQRWGEE